MTEQLDLIHRPRRLRRTAALRNLIAEVDIAPRNLIRPLFIDEAASGTRPITSMPGVERWSLAALPRIVEAAANAGIGAVLLFGVPDEKHDDGRGAWDDAGVVQRAVRRIKQVAPDLVVITDVCLCEYTSHGHCGFVPDGAPENPVNDASVAALCRVATSHAAAGADLIAPSDMFDGRIGAIRRSLDGAGFSHLPIVSYAAKFASAFYGPFREAAGSAPTFGDRRSHQMDPRNGREALREIELDIEQGADIVLVKPGLAYLDVLARARDRFDVPLAAYSVSGEYAMVKAAAANGWIDERSIVLESLTAFRRAGADLIVTYHALEAASWLRSR
ncbi:MAG: porphobilinogen synthase [Chloroflexota bacterium]|nr:MAG: porphobilinogen synthase [Chloroflexota bacterium]